MSNHVVACPQCQASLRSSRPFPSSQQIRCPQCGGHFVASNLTIRKPTTLDVQFGPPRSSTMLFAGIAAVVVVSSGIIGTGIWLARQKSDPPVATKETPRDPRADEERRLKEEHYKQVEERLRAFEEKEKRDQAIAKKREEFNRLMQQGNAALAKKSYLDAESAYGDALKLFPDNAEAMKGLISSRAAAGVDAKVDEDRKKQKATYDGFMADGAKAKDAKEYAAAQLSFEAALATLPGDVLAAKALAEVKLLIATDDAEKKKLADRQAEFQTRMMAGQQAMVRLDYETALREFIAAQLLMPGNAEALKARRFAEAQLDNLQDIAKRQANIQAMIQRGRTALRNQRFNDAIDAFTQVLRLTPDDRDAQQGLIDARAARNAAQADYVQLILLGDAAMQLQRFGEAVAYFQSALQLFPGDLTAQQGQLLAIQGMEAVQTTALAFPGYLEQGRIAYLAGRYADAVAAYTAALLLVPNDPIALAGLASAQAALDRQAKRAADVQRHLQAASQAMTARQFEAAIRAFTNALNLQADNQQAKDGLKKARYELAMIEGNQALRAKQYQEAIRFFEEALTQVPGDTNATTMLRQAKMLKK